MAIPRDEEGHYMIIMVSIHQEELTSINFYALNSRAPKYIKQLITNIKKLIDNNTTVVGTSTPHLEQRTGHLNRKSTRKQ